MLVGISTCYLAFPGSTERTRNSGPASDEQALHYNATFQVCPAGHRLTVKSGHAAHGDLHACSPCCRKAIFSSIMPSDQRAEAVAPAPRDVQRAAPGAGAAKVVKRIAFRSSC